MESNGNGADAALDEPREFHLKFWGTRGSISCSGAAYARYGGSTCCVEMRCGGAQLIFDAGSGICGLGLVLAESSAPKTDIFLSHCHFDHISGLPFFNPLYMASAQIGLWAGHFENGLTTATMLDEFMRPPFFPITPEAFEAQLDFHDFRAGQNLEPAPGITIRTAALNHPQGATGYRVEFNGKAACYVTDTELGPNGFDQRIVDLVEGSDLLIYDTMFTDEELGMCHGWGHSSWRQGVALADKAGVKTLALFHHHPKHNDTAMDRIAQEASAARPGGLIISRDQMTIDL
ncbi:MAG: MBL fold metallo-hydrolase [Alphaproteobacteria bacterium]